MTQSPAPVVGVSVIIFRDATAQEILLVERGKAPLLGYWSPPGGRVEWGETVLEAAQREVREECNIAIQIAPTAAFGTLDRIARAADGGVVYHFVLAGVVAIAEAGAVPQAGDDAAACQWVNVGDLSTLHPVVEDLEKVITLAKTRL